MLCGCHLSGQKSRMKLVYNSLCIRWPVHRFALYLQGPGRILAHPCLVIMRQEHKLIPE